MNQFSELVEIAMISDLDFAIPSIVALTTAKMSKAPASRYRVHFFLTSDGASHLEEYAAPLRSADFDIKLYPLEYSEQEKALDANRRAECFPGAVLVRLRLAELLPDVDRILHLDGDTVVRKDLTEMYRLPMGNALIGAVRDMVGEVKMSAHLTVGTPQYVNAGVLLMNLARMRREKTFALEAYRQMLDDPKLIYLDQDIINITCQNDMFLMHPRYNALIRGIQDVGYSIGEFNQFFGVNYENYADMEEDVVILHLAGPKKPWKYHNVRYADLWMTAYKQSPCAHLSLPRVAWPNPPAPMPRLLKMPDDKTPGYLFDAARGGDAQAQANVGDLYLYGYGVERSEELALEWYRQSAERRCYDGLFGVAHCYEYGLGVTPSLREAVSWYERATVAGVPEEEKVKDSRLRTNVLRGLGIAAEEGDPYAQYILGNKYFHGLGVARCCEKALEWYRRSAEQGNYWGCFNVARSYEYGFGVTCDLREACAWYDKASAIGVPPGEPEDKAARAAARLRGNAPYRLYYWKAVLNFGDQLNQDFAQYLKINHECVHAPAQADLYGIGSVLDSIRHRNSEYSCKILGSGFLMPPAGAEVWKCRPQILALRGKVSQARLVGLTGQNLQHVPLGDPGLLIQRMFPHIRRNPDSDIVGVLTHWRDKGSPVLRNIRLGRYRMKMIDISQASEPFVRAVAECRVVFSSAMHALICADSLGIPNSHNILGNEVEGGDYKFRDYYSAFENVPYEHLDLRRVVVTDDLVERMPSLYKITQQEVDAICDRLEAAAKQLTID